MDASLLTCESTYRPVAANAAPMLAKAGGGALCIYQHGRPVLDMWTGDRDPQRGTPWERDTMAMSWSTTKGVASTAVHLLADRGQLHYDDLVGDHWPEYATNGKERTTIRHVLAMEAGLFSIRDLVDDPRQLLDHDAMATTLAAAAPAHEPGAANAYHAFTYGWIVGEIVRRVAGVSLGQFIREHVSEPLQLDGFHIGAPESELARVAAFPNLKDESRVARAIAKTVDPVTSLVGVSPRRFANAFLPRNANSVIASADFLRAEVPSVNGVFTARSLARFYAALGADEGIDGVQLWSSDTRQAASTQQNDRRDRVLPFRVRWLLGYQRPMPRKKSSPGSFGFYGAYGSGAFVDLEQQVAVALVLHEGQGLPLLKLMDAIGKASDATTRTSTTDD